MSDSRIVYRPRQDATRESEAAALATVYSFLIDAAANKKAAGAPNTNGGDGTEIKGDSADGRSIP